MDPLANIGLVFGCSKGCEEWDCPLRDLRRLPEKERVDQWMKMTEKERDKIIDHHSVCTEKLCK